jgi:hypothetical protein
MQTLTRFHDKLAALPQFVVLAAPKVPPENDLKAMVRDILEGAPDRIYRDGIESVDRAEIVNGAIVGEFSDRVGVRAVKRIGFRIAPDSIDLWILNSDEVMKFSAYQTKVLALFAPMYGKGSRAKPKKCTNGLSCGNGCLRRIQASGKPTVCHKTPSPETKKKIETAIATAKPALISPDLPKNHVLGQDKRVTTEALDKVLRDLEDDDNRENLAKFRQFVELQGTRALFYKTGAAPTKKTKEAYSSELDTNPKLVKAPGKNTRGYTHWLTNHVVASHDKTAISFEPDAAAIKSSVKYAIEDVMDRLPPRWSFESKALTHSDSTALVYLHEMGHQVHYSNFNASIMDAPKGWKAFTKYGGSKDTEFAAEHFIPWLITPTEYRKADPIGFAWVDKMVNDSLKAKRLNGRLYYG